MDRNAARAVLARVGFDEFGPGRVGLTNSGQSQCFHRNKLGGGVYEDELAEDASGEQYTTRGILEPELIAVAAAGNRRSARGS